MLRQIENPVEPVIKKSSEFKTEQDFMDYFDPLSIEEKHDDPIGLLEMAQLALENDIEKSKDYCDRAIANAKKLRDPKFAEYVNEMAMEQMHILSIKYCLRGLAKEKENDKAGAKADFLISSHLDNPSANLKLAKIALAEEKPKDAKHYLELVLFTSKNTNEPHVLRAAAHSLLGDITLCEIQNKNATYNEFLKVVSHFSKAVAYDDRSGYREMKNALFSALSDEKVKYVLNLDSTPIHLDNGIIVTTSELLSKLKMTEEECDAFFTYPDPRKNTKVSNEEKSTAATKGLFSKRPESPIQVALDSVKKLSI